MLRAQIAQLRFWQKRCEAHESNRPSKELRREGESGGCRLTGRVQTLLHYARSLHIKILSWVAVGTSPKIQLATQSV